MENFKALFSRTFKIVAQVSGKVLDVAGASDADGTPIIVWPYQGSLNQHWRIRPVSDEFVRIVSVKSGKVLDVKGASRDDGTPIIIWPDNGGENQQWRINRHFRKGIVTISSRLHGKLLNVSGASVQDGAGVICWPEMRLVNERWQLVPIDLDAAEVAHFDEFKQPFDYEKIVDMPGANLSWENTISVRPPIASHGGSFLISLGKDHVWRAELREMLAKRSPLLTSSIPQVPAAVTNLVALLPGQVKLVNPAGFGSADNILVNEPGGSQVVIRQAVIKGSPASSSHFQTGAELFFASPDNGQSWSYSTALDPFDPAIAGGVYGRGTSQGGFDRVEANVARNSQKVFLTLHADGQSKSNSLLFSSTNGKHWTLDDASIPRQPVWLITSSETRLFLLSFQDEPEQSAQPYDLGLRWYKLEDTKRPIAEIVLKSECLSCFGRDPSVTVSVAGYDADGTYLHVGHPFFETVHVNGQPYNRQAYMIELYKVRDDGAKRVGEQMVICASKATGSVREVVCVESDIPVGVVGPEKYFQSLYYWRETDLSDQDPARSGGGPGWGRVTVKGKFVSGLDHWSRTFPIASDLNGTPRFWDEYNESGDYTKGAYFLDTVSASDFRHRFFAQWVEPDQNKVLRFHVAAIPTK